MAIDVTASLPMSVSPMWETFLRLVEHASSCQSEPISLPTPSTIALLSAVHSICRHTIASKPNPAS